MQPDRDPLADGVVIQRAMERAVAKGVRLTDVLAVCVDDNPGGLSDILEMLNDRDISVEYLYSFVRTSGDYAVIILYLSNLADGCALLEAKGVRMLGQAQVQQL